MLDQVAHAVFPNEAYIGSFKNEHFKILSSIILTLLHCETEAPRQVVEKVVETRVWSLPWGLYLTAFTFLLTCLTITASMF